MIGELGSGKDGREGDAKGRKQSGKDMKGTLAYNIGGCEIRVGL